MSVHLTKSRNITQTLSYIEDRNLTGECVHLVRMISCICQQRFLLNILWRLFILLGKARFLGFFILEVNVSYKNEFIR